ncbi:MAG: hypothetical protein ACRC2Y_04325 [Aeromonas veronii]
MAKPKSTLHKLRISQRHRNGSIWQYFEWLYGVWKDLECPDAYDFKKYILTIPDIDQIEGIREYRFENMVKTFRLQIEQDHLDMLNARRARSTETIKEISMFKSVNQQRQREQQHANYYEGIQQAQQQAPRTPQWWDDIPDAKEKDESVIWY